MSEKEEDKKKNKDSDKVEFKLELEDDNKEREKKDENEEKENTKVKREKSSSSFKLKSKPVKGDVSVNIIEDTEESTQTEKKTKIELDKKQTNKQTEQTESEPSKAEEKEVKEEQTENKKSDKDDKQKEDNQTTEEEMSGFSIDLERVIGPSKKSQRKSGLTKLNESLRKRYIRLEIIIPVLVATVVMYALSVALLPDPTQTTTTPEPVEQVVNKKEATPSVEKKHLKYTGSQEIDGVSVEASIVTALAKITTGSIGVTPPPEVPLTPEEIIVRKESNPWISKISIERLRFTAGKEANTFIASANTRVFVEQASNKKRLVIPLLTRALYEPEKKEVKIALLLKFNMKDLPKDKNFMITKTSDGNYQFFFKTTLILKPSKDKEE